MGRRNQEATTTPQSTLGVPIGELLGRMTQRQRIAIQNHCRLAGETVQPCFYEKHDDGLTLIVTVNSGYE